MKIEKIRENRLLTTKITNLVSGILILGKAVFIFWDSSAAIDLFVILIAFSLLVIGIARIIVGSSRDNYKKSTRFLKIVSGLIAILRD